jgi:hypothetical protein
MADLAFTPFQSSLLQAVDYFQRAQTHFATMICDPRFHINDDIADSSERYMASTNESTNSKARSLADKISQRLAANLGLLLQKIEQISPYRLASPAEELEVLCLLKAREVYTQRTLLIRMQESEKCVSLIMRYAALDQDIAILFKQTRKRMDMVIDHNGQPISWEKRLKSIESAQGRAYAREEQRKINETHISTAENEVDQFLIEDTLLNQIKFRMLAANLKIRNQQD